MSLERKIVLSFLISASLVGALAVATALSYLEIRRGIASLELSDTLRSKTLQLRRHEKNYFLYGEGKERRLVEDYLNEIEGILRAEADRHAAPDLASLRAHLDGYRGSFARVDALAEGFRSGLHRLLPAHPGLAPSLPLVDAVLLERPLVATEFLRGKIPEAEFAPLGAALAAIDAEIDALRHGGEEIIAISKGLDAGARERVEGALRHSRNAALLLFPLSLLAGLGALFAVSHSVVRRLKLLTTVIERTGKGEYQALLLPDASDEVGVLVGAVNTMERDLAARERELEEKNEELLQGRKLAAIGTLAAGVAHELNNPLNNISLSVQMLARELPPEASTPFVREIVGDVLSQTQRVKRIVGDLLEFSREKPPDLRPADLVGIVREAASRALPPGGGVTLRLEGEGRAPVMADAHQMTQVFVNLLANAADAMGGAGEVSVSVSRHGDLVRAAVADTGRGIHPDDLPKVFDPFFTTKERGTGLGLAIVYNAVRTHGGTLEVASVLERGTTFTVSLPAAR